MKKSAPTTKTPTKTRRSSTPGRRSKKKSTDRPVRRTLAYLGLGSNVGDRRDHLESALRELSRIARIERVSSFYRTEPVGYRDQRDFWNAVVAVSWRGSARSLLAAAREVERRVGRRRTFRNGPREIDVDVLDFGGRVADGDPILPHPRLTERRFALAPLAEIDPAWRDPRSGASVGDLLRALPRVPRVRRIAARSRTRRASGARGPER
jgi:2-amino-4-hydroxy-6-hydroxymethyldihydropteridine diphosphokinase